MPAYLTPLAPGISADFLFVVVGVLWVFCSSAGWLISCCVIVVFVLFFGWLVLLLLFVCLLVCLFGFARTTFTVVKSLTRASLLLNTGPECFVSSDGLDPEIKTVEGGGEGGGELYCPFQDLSPQLADLVLSV